MARRKSNVGCVIAGVIVLAFFGLCVSSISRSLAPPSPGSAEGVASGAPLGSAVSDEGTPATRALLGFGKGDRVGRSTVHAVFSVVDHGLPIELESGSERLTVYVALKGGKSFKPPRETARYALFFSGTSGFPTEERDAALAAIESRLTQVEATAVVPAGL